MYKENNTKEDLSSRILEKIQKEHISPTHRGYFKVRNSILWLPGIIVTTLGGFAWAGIFFNSTHSSHAYKDFIRSPEIPFILKELPLIWVIFFLIFILFVIKAVRQTKNGYKYKATQILGISLALSIVMGLILYVFDMDHKNPLVRMPTERIQKELWFNPMEGRIVGTFLKTPDEKVYFKDIQGKEWIILKEDIPEVDELLFSDGNIVRIIGQAQDENVFLACIILPGNLDKRDRNFKRLPPPKKEDIQNEKCKIILQKIKQERGERKSLPSS